MFRKTRLRLVLLNSAIFFFILMFFGAVLYFFTAHRLYMEDDKTLLSTAQQIERGHADAINEHHDMPDADENDPHHMTDERTELRQSHILYVLRDREGKVVGQVPPGTITATAMAALPASTPTDQFRTLKLEGQQYRLYTVSVPPGFVTSDGTGVCKIQLLYNQQDDRMMLSSFLKVVEISSVIGACLAMLGGLYLASLALVPIQKAWERQQQFVADASHELRTPITVIQMHLERLFRHPDHTIEHESEHLAKMMRESNRMRRLVLDLLTLANVDSNQLQIIKEPVQLDVLLATLVEQFRYLADDKDIEIEVQSQSPLTILGDEERIRQLLTILLDNAVKYSHREGVIEVACSSTLGTVQLTVSDHGVGIAAADLPHIFERFYRADRARSTEGTGLGLAIAKWIVEEHHGKIRVTSQLGKGTTFYVSLPVKAAD